MSLGVLFCGVSETLSSNGRSFDGTGLALKKTAKICEVGGNWSPCPSFRFRRPWYFYMEARALSMRRERIPILSVLRARSIQNRKGACAQSWAGYRLFQNVFFTEHGIFKSLILNIILSKPVYYKSALFFVSSSSIFDIYVANEDVNNKNKHLKDNSEIYKSFQIYFE